MTSRPSLGALELAGICYSDWLAGNREAVIAHLTAQSEEEATRQASMILTALRRNNRTEQAEAFAAAWPGCREA